MIMALPFVGLAQANITVSINNMEEDDGDVIFMLYDNDEGFPDEPNAAMKIGKVKATTETEPTFTFEKVPPGKYAISAFQDKDSNGEVKYFGPIPRERVGAVGHDKFGKPKFDKLVFEVKQSDTDKNFSVKFIN